MDTIQEINKARNQAIREIGDIFTELIRTIENRAVEPEPADDPANYDIVYPLNYPSAEFKGTKPTSLIFGREKVAVGAWTAVFAEIMRRCNSDIDRHRSLMNLRSRVSGRTRVILSDRPDGMRTPLKIDNKLYAEIHYDTGTLLHVLLHRILDPVKYDYRNIYVAVRSDR